MTTINAVISTKRNPIARFPLVSFFTLAIVFAWFAIIPSLLWDLPFKPFQTMGAYGPFLAAVEDYAEFHRRHCDHHAQSHLDAALEHSPG